MTGVNFLSTFLCLLLADAPATQPAGASDANVDWLLSQPAPANPTTHPTTAPAAQPSPLVNRSDPGSRAGTVTLSDGIKLKGQLSTTPGKPLRLWSEKEKRYIDIPWDSIASMKAVIVWERLEDDWRFKESGSDIKVLSGKKYPAHELVYHVTQLNGDEFEGGLVGPVLIQSGEQVIQKVLHKRDKGALDQQIKDLVYVKTIEFDQP